MVAAIDRTVSPIVDYVVGEGEIINHTNTRVAACVACPQVVVKRAVVATQSAAECVIVGIEPFAED